MFNRLYRAVLLLVGFATILTSCMPAKKQTYLKQVVFEHHSLQAKVGDNVYLGSDATPIGRVILVKNEPHYHLILIEFFKETTLHIPSVSNTHPLFKEPVIRLSPAKKADDPYKYLVLILTQTKA